MVYHSTDDAAIMTLPTRCTESLNYLSSLTTPLVLWKITPLFADWISSPTNPLWKYNLLSSSSVIAELGTGISALVALTLAPSVHHYVATDQEYVQRLFRTNVEANTFVTSPKPKGGKSKSKSTKQAPATTTASKITFTTLDWESDDPRSLKAFIASGSGSSREKSHKSGSESGEDDLEGDEDPGFDLLLSCDCIYNEALIAPFVRTCAEICRLRAPYTPSVEEEVGCRSRRPTVCIVAQQQRLPEVFETWLRETMREFRVWRLSDDVLGDELKGGTGYLVHLLLVRE